MRPIADESARNVTASARELNDEHDLTGITYGHDRALGWADVVVGEHNRNLARHVDGVAVPAGFDLDRDGTRHAMEREFAGDGGRHGFTDRGNGRQRGRFRGDERGFGEGVGGETVATNRIITKGLVASQRGHVDREPQRVDNVVGDAERTFVLAGRPSRRRIDAAQGLFDLVADEERSAVTACRTPGSVRSRAVRCGRIGAVR